MGFGRLRCSRPNNYQPRFSTAGLTTHRTEPTPSQEQTSSIEITTVASFARNGSTVFLSQNERARSGPAYAPGARRNTNNKSPCVLTNTRGLALIFSSRSICSRTPSRHQTNPHRLGRYSVRRPYVGTVLPLWAVEVWPPMEECRLAPWAQGGLSREKLSPLQTVSAAALEAIAVPSAVGDPSITPNSVWRVYIYIYIERERAREGS